MLTLPQGNAICYSGYREGQSPDSRRYPAPEQVREDLLLLARHFRILRLYDCSEHAEVVLDSDGTARLRWIRTGRLENGRIEVLSGRSVGKR